MSETPHGHQHRHPLRREADDAGPPPSIDKLTSLFSGKLEVRSVALTCLLVLAVLFALRAAEQVVVPTVLAMLLSVMLSPIVSWLRHWLRVPPGLGAALVLFGIVGALGAGAYFLSEPIDTWMDDIPAEMRRAETKIRGLTEKIEGLKKAGETLDSMAESGKPDTLEVRVEEPTLSRFVLSQTWVVIAFAFLTGGLTYFLLAADDLFLNKLVRVIPRLKDKKTAVDIVHHVRRDISNYIFTISVINALLGVAVGIAMWMLGVPNAVLWGLMAALFNFIPFLGAIFGVVIISMVALAHFDNTAQALVAPAVYYALTSIEGSFITPMVLGRRLVLNTVVIFLSLIFWGWMWGLAGIFLAVPMMSALKIVCDRIEPLRAIGEFLGR